MILLLAAGCHTPASRSWLSALRLVQAQAEAAAGRREAPHLEAKFGGIVRDPQAERRMEKIADRLTKGLPHASLACRCRMLASPHVDAFSLPGGLIYVTRGYYDRLANDDHLAAILAHEIAHMTSKDHLKPPCRMETETLAREVSADCRAVLALSRAGYRPGALAEALKLLGPHRSGRWGGARLQAASSVAMDLARTELIGPEFPQEGWGPAMPPSALPAAASVLAHNSTRTDPLLTNR